MTKTESLIMSLVVSFVGGMLLWALHIRFNALGWILLALWLLLPFIALLWALWRLQTPHAELLRLAKEYREKERLCAKCWDPLSKDEEGSGLCGLCEPRRNG